MSASRGTAAALVTGGAGFVGTNLAHRLLSQGRRVIVFDDLSRRGVCRNLDWLRDQHGELVEECIADVRDFEAVQAAVAQASDVYHLAAQVAVTTSLAAPLEDFEINARGTLNVLEAVRRQPCPPALLFTSTNKVYGALADVPLERQTSRYVPADPQVRARGIDERRPLEFHSPYGCSKGAADQYVLDYARCFALPAVVFRMSCIYGPHQCGNADQGWVAHFLISAREHAPLTLYGDGLQVRDVLYVEDLVDAMQLAIAGIRRVAGRAFNIGGGAANTVSLIELLELLRTRHGLAPQIALADWRSGDQKYYVSDTRCFAAATGWQPRTSVEDGVGQLLEWLETSAPRRPVRQVQPLPQVLAR